MAIGRWVPLCVSIASGAAACDGSVDTTSLRDPAGTGRPGVSEMPGGPTVQAQDAGVQHSDASVQTPAQTPPDGSQGPDSGATEAWPRLADCVAAPGAFTPDLLAADAAGFVYLLSSAQQALLRWHYLHACYLAPVPLPAAGGALVTSMATAGDARLYLGYDNGEIRWLDLRRPLSGFAPFARLGGPVRALTAIGERLLAVDADEAWIARHHLLDASGSETAVSEWPLRYGGRGVPYQFDGPTYDPTLQRYYFFCDEASARDVCAEQIDVAQGTFGAHVIATAQFGAAGPIRVSADGERLITGFGTVYTTRALEPQYRLTANLKDAEWLADGGLLSLHSQSDGVPGVHSVLDHYDANGTLVAGRSAAGAPLGLLPSAAAFVMLSSSSGEGSSALPGPGFGRYEPERDADGDGVRDYLDAFPSDGVAAIDRDQDGAPDAWNPGRDGSGSPLTLDAYPDDPRCTFVGEWPAGESRCGYVAEGGPWPQPIQLEIDELGVVYWLTEHEVRRYDVGGHVGLAPLRLALPASVRSGRTLRSMAYSTEQRRLYVADASGAVTLFELSSEPPLQRQFRRVGSTLGLSGSFLGMYRGLGTEFGYFDAEGQLVSSFPLPTPSSAQQPAQTPRILASVSAYDATRGREYFTEPLERDLFYVELNPETAQVIGSGASHVAANYRANPLLRVSPTGTFVLLNNQVYAADTLTPSRTLDPPVNDALWLADDHMLTARQDPSVLVPTGLLELRDPSGQVVDSLANVGLLYRLLPWGNRVVVVSWNANAVGPVPTFSVWSLDPFEPLF